MPNQKPIVKNVIWIIVDSVRNYHTDADDRGRIAIMDKLAKEAIEFKTAVTSAPSTIMSTSAMMTGVPAIFHSRTYNDFDFKGCGIKSLPRILEKEGYNLYNIVFFPEGRIFLAPMLGNICQTHWPRNAKPNEFWGNDTVNDILISLIKGGLKEPFFLYINYNCRHDPHTSEKVEYGLNMIEERGLLEDTVLIINSDHGYPDPSREITYYERRSFGHDQIMTDDNILTPLVISYPGCKQQKIAKPVSLLDIMPTILDIIGKPDLYEVSGYPSYGQSLLDMIEGHKNSRNPIVRIDNRYIFQDKRISSLRSDKYKYIYSFDDNVEEFYDLINDPEEQNNISKKDEYVSIVESFREKLFIQENFINTFHDNKMREACNAILKKKYRSAMFLGWPHRNFIKMMAMILPDYGVERVLVFENDPSRKILLLKTLKKLDIELEIVDDITSVQGSVDIAFAILTNNDPRMRYLARKQAEQLNPGDIIYLNYNLRIFERPPFWFKPLLARFIRTMLPRLRKDPKEFFVDLVVLTKRVFFKYNV